MCVKLFDAGHTYTIIFKTDEQSTVGRREAIIKEINKPLANFTGLYTCAAMLPNGQVETIEHYIYFYPGI